MIKRFYPCSRHPRASGDLLAAKPKIPAFAGMTVLLLFLLLTACFESEHRIHIVGSSTVYPFVTLAAEQFGRATEYKTPIVESTGTGGGFKLFCSGAGEGTPDLSNASRPIKDSERDQCAANGVTAITEIKLGYDGIALANKTTAPRQNFTLRQLFLALAIEVPVKGKLVKNPYQRWSDIDPSLPSIKIQVYGPPPTSGTRDAFVELVMEPGCVDLPEFTAAYPDKEERKKACHMLREDGGFIDAGENDNLIIQKLQNNEEAFGIFGFSFLEQNASIVQGSLVDGFPPAFEHIASGDYPISRSLFVYLKNAHLQTSPGLKQFAQELVSINAAGGDGYMLEKGLIPLMEEELAEVQERIRNL